MRVIYMEELYELGVKGVIEEARRVAGSGPTYVSFDVDGLACKSHQDLGFSVNQASAA